GLFVHVCLGARVVAQTMLRQLFLSAYQCHLFTALETSRDETLAALASKSLKEVRYHLRHSSEWIIRFGQGTEESRSRISNAIEYLWSYVEEMFDTDEIEQKLTAEGLAADSSTLRELWYSTIREIFREAGLHIPEKYNSIRGSRQGKHSEHLGHLLAEMQMLHRSFPGAEW
ncbi:MAG: 1,2-phenylacetyl-CoA epoxidase subunit PaaC, partial [Bacteroidota bacterium]